MRGEDEFREFAQARTPALLRSAVVLCGNRHSAEDLVQDTLAKVYAVWGTRLIDSPVAYAHQTLVRTFISSRRRRSSTEQPLAVVPDGVVPDEDVATRIDVLTALAALSDKDRAVVVLRYLEDRSVAETADALHMSTTAVRSRCMRAVARLRDSLAIDLRVKEETR